MTGTKPNNPFELLRSKSLIAILDGDTDFGEITVCNSKSSIKNSMPYLSGPIICDISCKFGLAVAYGWNGGAKSRWNYLDDLMKYCIDNNCISDLLSFLFSKEQFVDKLKGYSPTDIETAHKEIVEMALEKINGLLYFGGNALHVVGNQFQIRPIGSTVTISAPAVKKLDRDYIRSLSERAMKDIDESNYDSAITKSRTMLEEVFCYVIEKKKEDPSSSGDIGKLYNQVKTLYSMHQHEGTDKRINMLLSGLEKIVTAIAQMRNKGSDSHGLGAKRININDYHALLVVNSATTMADFILSVGESANKHQS